MTAAIRADFTGYRTYPGRGVTVLHMEIPMEATDATIAALGGTPLPSRSAFVGIVRLKEPTAPAAGAAIREDAGATPSVDTPAAGPHPLVKRAGVLAKDPGFWIWSGCSTEATAAAFIRTRCQIASRRDLAMDARAAKAFEALEAEYRASQYSPHLTGRK